MKGIGVFILVIVLLIGASLGGLAWRYYTAEIRGTVDAEEQIEGAASRISRYEHFFSLCSSAQTLQASLDAQKERLEYVSDDSEASRVRSNIAGIRSNLHRTVNQYNAEAGKDYTSARFQASNLPYNINAEDNITCAN